VAESLLDYYDAGISTFLIRGFDPLEDALQYGRELIFFTRYLLLAAMLLAPHVYAADAVLQIGDSKGVLLQDFIGRLSRAQTWARQHPKDFAALYSRQTGRSLEVSDLMIRHMSYASRVALARPCGAAWALRFPTPAS
jgi:hypothetical protein